MKRKMHDTQKKRNGWKVKQVDEVAEAGEDLHVAEAGETLHVAEAADISNNGTGVVADQREETKQNTKVIKDELDEKWYKMNDEKKGISKQGFPEEARKFAQLNLFSALLFSWRVPLDKLSIFCQNPKPTSTQPNLT